MIGFIILLLIIKIAWLMYQAKPKHRKEMLELSFCHYNSRIPLGISLPRALGPLFAIFEGRPIGFLFSAVQILVYDQYGRISFGIREPDRRKKWIGDFGVAGMVPSKTDISQVAKDEMFEEIGLSNIEPMFLTTLMPQDGFPCVTHLFAIRINSKTTALISKDGTYEKINWIKPRHLRAYLRRLRVTYPYSKLYSDSASAMLNMELIAKYRRFDGCKQPASDLKVFDGCKRT